MLFPSPESVGGLGDIVNARLDLIGGGTFVAVDHTIGATQDELRAAKVGELSPDRRSHIEVCMAHACEALLTAEVQGHA